MNKNQVQQGDVILNRVNLNISKATKVKKNNRGIVLAEGEATGHYHGIEVEESEAELIQLGEKMLLNVKADSVTLKHQEHKPITIDKGVWEVGQVVEKDWLNNMVRKVVD
jgi:hypothetical protein